MLPQDMYPFIGRVFGALFVCIAVSAASGSAPAVDPPPNLGYSDTPFLPGGKWRVHDGARPQPATVTPGPALEKPLPPPSDAVVLFDGSDLSHWQNKNWIVKDGYMEAHNGQNVSVDSFGDCQLHIEWCTPTPATGSGQGRGNSGVYLMGRYEIQVLDSYENPTYPDGQAGAVYGQYPPLVNASRKPGEWQSYDIAFTAPRFEGEKLVKPAYVTVFHNGILVQNHVEILGDGTHRQLARYTPIGSKAPLALQDHGDPVRYRNIWYRPLPPTE